MSRSAFSISEDSTKAFEMSLRKRQNSCNERCARFRATIYAIWILLYKHHGLAPGKSCLKAIFFAFATFLAIDLVLVIGMLGHIFNPASNFLTIGIPFLLLYPAIAVLAPLFGTLGCVTGSVKLLRVMSSMHSTCVLVNYPLTIIM